MTVSTEVSHNEYTGNGVTTTFPYTFRILNKADLVVQTLDTNGNMTTLVRDTNYTVTGAGSYSGGNIILTGALPSGWEITIDRELNVVQETDLRNQGKFFAEVHENAFDYLTMLIQQCFGWSRLALLKPSFIARYYDAKQNKISNLADPGAEQDAVNNRSMRNYVDAAIAGVVGGFGWFIQYGSGAIYRSFQDKMRDIVCVKDFGAKVDGSADDTAAYNAVSGTPAQVPDGTSKCSPGLFSVAGLIGGAKSHLKQISMTGNFLSFRKPEGGRIANLNIESNKGGVITTQGHQIDIQDGNNVTLENLNFTGVEGTGFSIILYNNTIPYQEGFIIKGIRGKYTKSVTGADSGCVLLALNRKSLVDGVIATGYAQFGATELKDDAKYNVTSNIIGDDCENTVYLGTQTSQTPNANVINNIIAAKPGFSAIEVGGGHHNLMSNILADYTDSAATQAHGITTTGDANVADNIFMMGCTGVNSVGGSQPAYNARFRGSAKNNYASIFPHYTASGIVNFEVGTTRNFVEIKHPGARTSIFAQASAIGDKSTITGDANSNVVHAPALGQYYGTMSGMFDWRIKEVSIPSGVMITSDRFRFIADGDVGAVFGGGTTARLKLFTADGTTRAISLVANQTLRLETGSGTYLQLGATALTPNQTNTYTLGTASNAWAGGTTQTAFTVLSDERAKGKPLMLAHGSLPFAITSDERVMEENSSDKMLDAWAEVDLVQYQLLDRIEVKGEDGARWHFGVLAQRAVEAFARHGLDAHRFAFLCYDEWEDQYVKVQTNEGETVTMTRTVSRPVMEKVMRDVPSHVKRDDGSTLIVMSPVEVEVPKLEAMPVFSHDGTPRLDENGAQVTEMVPVMEEIEEEYTAPADPEYTDVLEIPAGNRYGIRYEEALVLEAALQRRNYERLKNQHNEMIARIEAIESR